MGVQQMPARRDAIWLVDGLSELQANELPFVAAVDQVAEHGVAGVGEVATDLVASSGQRCRCDKGVLRPSLEDLALRDGSSSIGGDPDLVRQATVGIQRDRGVDHEAVVGWRTRHDR